MFKPPIEFSQGHHNKNVLDIVICNALLNIQFQKYIYSAPKLITCLCTEDLEGEQVLGVLKNK